MKALKTTLIFNVLLFCGVMFAYSASHIPIGSAKLINATFYRVNVHFNSDASLCNIYLVQIVNEAGAVVAPPQVFHPEIGTYTFAEKGPVNGTRIAVLILESDIPHFVCSNELYSARDTQTGNFFLGQTYNFNLYPKVIQPNPVPGGLDTYIGKN